MSQLYFIAVVLPEDLDKEIRDLKKHMHHLWGCKVALKSPAHLTIFPPWWMDSDLEGYLVNAAELISCSIDPFEVRLQNFSAFPPRTIFVAVHQSEALYHLKSATDRFFLEQQAFPAQPDTRKFYPHVTIATRDLHKKSFAEAWALYENKHYERSFIASGLTLLRHNGLYWDKLHTAPFRVPERK